MIRRISDTEYELGSPARILAPGMFWDRLEAGVYPIAIDGVPVELRTESERVIPMDYPVEAPVKTKKTSEEA